MTGEDLLLDPDAQQAAAAAFERVVATAREDERIVGVLLGGGRGKGIARPWSDFDVYVIVADGVDPAVVADELDDGVLGVEISVDRADRDPPAWNRYNFAHLVPVVDKLGDGVGGCVARWSALPAEEADGAAVHWLSAFLNQAYRALKNDRDGLTLEAHLDGVESVGFFLEAVFAMHGRLRPYNKFLRWELERYPIEGTSADEVVWVTAGMAAGDPVALRAAVDRVLTVAARRGYLERVVADWGAETLRWMRHRG